MSYRSIQVDPTTGVGAFVRGVDLARFDDDTLAELKDAFSRYSVLFFREQHLTEEQHIALAERWGEINVNRFFAAVSDYPKIAVVLKEPEQKVNIGEGWHTDHSYDLSAKGAEHSKERIHVTLDGRTA